MIAIAGNPNSGKTAFFNLLTGARQKTGNFPGVTVEKKEGLLKGIADQPIKIIDLPGTYSLDAESPDEAIAQEILLGQRLLDEVRCSCLNGFDSRWYITVAGNN